MLCLFLAFFLQNCLFTLFNHCSKGAIFEQLPITASTSPPWAETPQTRKFAEEEARRGEQRWAEILKMALLQKHPTSQLRFQKWHSQAANTNFALQNKWFQKARAAYSLFAGRLLTHKSRKCGPDTAPPAHTYIYIYIYVPDGCWGGGGSAFQKRGRLGVHLKAGSGTTRVRNIKIGISEEKCGRSKNGQKSQVAPPMGQEVCFVETHTWICARENWARSLFGRVLPLQK